MFINFLMEDPYSIQNPFKDLSLLCYLDLTNFIDYEKMNEDNHS